MSILCFFGLAKFMEWHSVKETLHGGIEKTCVASIFYAKSDFFPGEADAGSTFH